MVFAVSTRLQADNDSPFDARKGCSVCPMYVCVAVWELSSATIDFTVGAGHNFTHYTFLGRQEMHLFITFYRVH